MNRFFSNFGSKINIGQTVKKFSVFSGERNYLTLVSVVKKSDCTNNVTAIEINRCTLSNTPYMCDGVVNTQYKIHDACGMKTCTVKPDGTKCAKHGAGKYWCFDCKVFK